MPTNGLEGLTLKALIAVALAMAVVIGFALPAPHGAPTVEPKSQFDTIELGRG